MVRDLGRISAAHALITNAPLLPRWEQGLHRRAVVRSVHHSTRLEGNTLTRREVRDLLNGREVEASRRDRREALNYSKVLEFIDAAGRGAETPVAESDLKHIHTICMDGLPGHRAHAGHYRKVQNRIVRTDPDGQRTVYLPPPAGEVSRRMTELFGWIGRAGRRGVSPFIIAGMAQYELEAIHPFLDGNGRAGRALSALVLYRNGYDTKRLFSLEEYYDRDPARYYAALATVGTVYPGGRRSDATMWIEYFIEGIADEMVRIEKSVRDYLHAEKRKRRLAQVELNDRQLKIMTWVNRRRSLTNLECQKKFEISPATAKRDLQALVDKKLIQRVGITGKGVYYVLP
jgi:Fic family protein